jgi:hypothetical protein
MKKIAVKIAMVLVIIMIANTFSGCFTMGFYSDTTARDNPILFLFGWIVTVPLDIITSPVQITVWAIKKDIEQKRDARGKKMDGIDTFSTVNSLPELGSLTRKMSSLPEEKIIPFTETINSFSEEENLAMLKAFNNLSEKEITSSIKTLNSMSGKKLIATLNSFQNIRRKQ